MIAKKVIYLIIVSIAVALISCEEEKIEYKKQYSGSFFSGFAIRSKFIIHDETISYYNPDSNRVFENLFEHQNGRKLGKSIHSMKFVRNWNDIYCIITVEGENKIEIVDKNFISIKQIQLDRPRNISLLWGNFGNNDVALISYGDANNGGIAVIPTWDFSIAHTINTGNNPGQMYVYENFIYTLSDGTNDSDSTIAKIYYGDSHISLQKVEDIAVGKRPVSLFGFTEGQTGYRNQSLFIHCLGNENESPSLVFYDLIRNRIIDSYSLNPNEEYPEKILYFSSYKNEIIYNSNKKLYLASLQNLDSPDFLSDHNILGLHMVGLRNVCQIYDSQNDCIHKGSANYFLGISENNNEGQQYLFRFNVDRLDKEFFELIDSIPIGSNARKIIGWL